jgi:hypothetical protein
MLIHIDEVHVHVPQKGTGIRGGLWCERVGEDQATIRVDWLVIKEDGHDGAAYSEVFYHPVGKLSDLAVFTIGKVRHNLDDDWVDFTFYLTAEYGFYLLKQHRERCAHAELWEAPWRKRLQR